MVGFTLHTIHPTANSPAARLAFTVEIQEGWQQVPLPAEEVDFSQPDKFLPLAIFMARYGAVLFTAAARPAFDDGAVSQWVEFLCEKQGLTVTARAIIDARFGKALLAGATQPSDAGEMSLRLVFFEDGGSLVQFGVMAPTQIFPSLEEPLMHTLASVQLLTPQGATHPLVPAAAKEEGKVQTFKDFARPENAGALEASHKVVAYFQNNGLGLVPRVQGVDKGAASVTLAPAAVRALITVPEGWHVVDDSRRTLIFDKGTGGTQINLSVMGGMKADDLFAGIERDVLIAHPGAEHRRMELEGVPTLAFRGLKVDGETLDQIYLVRPHPTEEDAVVVFRVTCVPAETVGALNLTELVLKSVRGAA